MFHVMHCFHVLAISVTNVLVLLFQMMYLDHINVST